MEEKMINIIKKAQMGDEEAFQRIYDRYYRQALHYAMKICKNDADAQDVVQDAFLSIHKALPTLKHPEYFNAWMSKIIFTKSTKLFSRNKDLILPDEKIQSLNAREQRVEYIPENNFHANSDLEVLQGFIRKLDSKLAVVINYVYLEQKSLQETADILDIPLGTVKSRTTYGRKELLRMVKTFEKNEGRSLDFKLESTASLGILAFLSSKFKNKGKLFSAEATKFVVLACLITVCAGIGMLTKSGWNHRTREIQKPQQHANSSIQPTLQMEDYKNAYFTMLYWADTKEQMETKSADEIAEIFPLYEQLKDTNNTYHTLLEDINWFENFESVL